MRQKYILAVSGGVDSVVLLHTIMQRRNAPQLSTVNYQSPVYIIAHIDHGIRKDSHLDAEFVKSFAKEYDTTFETIRLELGESASEEQAREARYEFLFSLLKKYKADAIITAHHQDDVLETMLINMIRNSGPRGLVGFSRSNILRPFMNRSKQDIIKYAKEHNLQWREDSTNLDPKYMRNYMRQSIVPRLESKRQELLEIHAKTKETYRELDLLAKKLLEQSMHKGELVRSRFVILPYVVQCELMVVWLRLNGIKFDKNLIEKAVLASKTLSPGKKLELSSSAYLLMAKTTIVLNVHVPHV